MEDLNSNSVCAFADAEFPSQMRQGKIPGAVFVVVKDGQVICEKAYGIADLQTRQAVSADETLFRVASISKIFTAASALQLVRAHRLNLHTNVNHYLTGFQIARAFGEPVTLFDLLTHSGGFDDCDFDYASHSAASRLSLRSYLALHQPARVRPPGRFRVYDNYGFALAGYLVQKASGVPFADYVERQILAPLDMDHSSFAPDKSLRTHLAAGYWLDDGTPRACRRSYVNIVPAAGLCATADDMSKFLAALLTGRQPDGKRIFPPGVIAGLETPQLISNPDLPGQCFGFNGISLAGRSALRQSGQWPGFNSVLLLFPQQHCGIFMAYNLCDYWRMEQKISRRFVEKFIPPDSGMSVAEKPDSPVEDSFASLSGIYLSARHAKESPEINPPREMNVTATPNGGIEVNGQPYQEIEPLVFEKKGTSRAADAPFGSRIAFELGRDGAVTRLLTQSDAYRRAPWIESTEGNTFLLDVVSIIFLSAVMLWPLMALVRLDFQNFSLRRAGEVAWRQINFSFVARITAFAACVLALWFEISFALARHDLKPFAELYGFPSAIKRLLWVLPVLSIFCGAMMLISIGAWRKRIWRPAHRLHYTLLAGALAVFLYIFYSHHLFG